MASRRKSAGSRRLRPSTACSAVTADRPRLRWFRLFGRKLCLQCLHHRHFRIPEAEAFQLLCVRSHALRVDDGVATLAMIIATEPKGDVVRIGDLVSDELLA